MTAITPTDAAAAIDPASLTAHTRQAALALHARIAALPDTPDSAPDFAAMTRELAALVALPWQDDYAIAVEPCSQCGSWTYEDALTATYARTGYIPLDPADRASEPTGERLCRACLGEPQTR